MCAGSDMAMSMDQQTIDITFHELINPSNSEYLDDTLPEFLQRIQLDDESIMKVVALIGHKLQSPLELEALTACHIAEYSVFQNDKFRMNNNSDGIL